MNGTLRNWAGHRWRRLNWARLNHVLIPGTKEGRDRFRRNPLSRWVVGPITRVWLSLTTEGRALLALAVAASLGGLDVRAGDKFWLWGGCLALLGSSILLRPLMKLRGVSIGVEGPVRAAWGAPAQFQITLVHRGDRDQSGLRVQLPFLPWDGTWLDENLRVAELKSGTTFSLQATARFVERGHHHIDAFAVGALVPLGLAVGPLRESRGTHFVVVPQIAPVAEVQSPERARHQKGGVVLASRTGESLELAGLREWQHGDRLRDLSARGWARRGEPLVREYQQEYFNRVVVLLDDDDTEATEDVVEAVISLTAGIVEYLLRGEALVDLCIGGRTLKLGRSLGGIDQALDVLASVRGGASFDDQSVFSELMTRLDGLSSVFVVGMNWSDSRKKLADDLQRAGLGVRWFRVVESEVALAESKGEADSRCRLLSEKVIEKAIESRSGLRL